MTLQHPATCASPALIPPIPPKSSRQQIYKILRDAGLIGKAHSSGPIAVEHDFGHAYPWTARKRRVVQLPGLIIVALDDSSELRIDRDDHEHAVLTGEQGKRNDCLLIFDHSYGSIRCRIRKTPGSAEATLQFIAAGSLETCDTLTIGRNLENRPSQGKLWMTLEYRAEPLREMQGLAWRGGHLEIASLTLIP